jgi:hypothetical protein
MALSVRITPAGLYEATASPPHVAVPWSTTTPIPARQLVDELLARGCHQQDIGDALCAQDPNWRESLQ